VQQNLKPIGYHDSLDKEKQFGSRKHKPVVLRKTWGKNTYIIATKKTGITVRNRWSPNRALKRLWRPHKTLRSRAKYEIWEEIILQLYKHLLEKEPTNRQATKGYRV
jgi:hypothetical protein